MTRFRTTLFALLAAAALLLSACAPATSLQPEHVPDPPEQPPAAEEPVQPPAEPLPAPAAPDFEFTRDNLPRLDGSTSTAPLARAICAALLGEDTQSVADLIQFSRTTQSYRNLMDGGADLLLAAEPAPEVLGELEADGTWLLTPFATDALVFVVNEDNPVDNLTTEQVQQIYSGEITNWSQVGGDDLEIVPFQRNAEAGSQTMFEKLVMAGQPLMDPPSQWLSDSMSGLLDSVREYDNSPSAIGYTVYYYANDMEMARGLKVLSIDGVSPSAEAIRAGEYPFLNPYFVAISRDAAEDSSTRALYDWVLSVEGQTLAAAEGYVPVLAVSGETQDTSALQPDMDGGRRYPHAVYDLIPADDYGPLYPYAGACVTAVQRWEDSSGVEHSWSYSWPTPLYGLMTADGAIVTDPGYQGVFFPIDRADENAPPPPALILSRSAEDWVDDCSEGRRYAVAARDGSWCTGFDYWDYTVSGDPFLLVGPDGVTRLDIDTGDTRLWSWQELGIAQEDLFSLMSDLRWLYGFTCTPQGVYLGRTQPSTEADVPVRLFHPVDGTMELIPLSRWEEILYSDIQSDWELTLWDYHLDGELIHMSRNGQSHTLPRPQDMEELGDVTTAGDLAILVDYSGEYTRSWLYRLSDGELLLQNDYFDFLTDFFRPGSDVLICATDFDAEQVIYTAGLEPLLRFDSDGTYALYRDGLITVQNDETFFAAYDARTGECLFYRNLFVGDD